MNEFDPLPLLQAETVWNNKKNIQNFDYAKYWFQDKLKIERRGESLAEKVKEINSRKGLGLEYLVDLVLSIQYTS